MRQGKRLLLIIIIVLGVGFCCQQVLAQAATGLSITPPLNDLAVKPGETINYTVKLKNHDETLKIIYPHVLCFQPDNETGVPQFLKPTETTPDCLQRSWVEFSQDSIILNAREDKEFSFIFIIPSDATPGTHYGAVAFAEQPELAMINEQIVMVNAQLASLFFVKVAGATIESGEVSEFSSNKKWYLNSKEEIIFTSGFKNTGNVHYRPNGQITIYNYKNQQITALPVNQGSNAGYVLPQSQRKWQTVWTDRPRIGRFTADLTFFYGGEQKITKTQNLTFYLIPLKEISIGVGAIILIIILILVIRLYKRWQRRHYQKRYEK